MKSKKLHLGIDIGGTNINMGVLEEDKGLLFSEKISTDVGESNALCNFSRISSKALNMVKSLKVQENIISVGIGVPGTVDKDEGRVIFAPNVKWKDIDRVNLKDFFGKALKAPVFLAQDTEAAVLGEFLYGGGRGYESIVCITVGTGIGCGIILDSKLYKGSFGTAGEIGHTIVEKDGLLCGCGKRGCLEAYSSATGILRFVEDKVRAGASTKLLDKISLGEITAYDIFDAAKTGDNLSQEAINTAVDYLSIGIINLVNILCPEKVILSGGISQEREIFVNPLIQKTREGMYSWLKDKVTIETAQLGENAPLVGAAALHKYFSRES